jgi:hypothetical protein
MIPIETIPGMGRSEDKGEWERGWIQVWYIWYIVRIFVDVTMYPHPAQQLKIKKNPMKCMKLIFHQILIRDISWRPKIELTHWTHKKGGKLSSLTWHEIVPVKRMWQKLSATFEHQI